MYYIYELWNPVTNEPIYVGYGKTNRMSYKMRHEDHLREAVRYKNNTCKKTNVNMYKINVILQMLDIGIIPEYRFPFTNLSYEDACLREKELIALYGRRCIGTGPLTNLDSGGRGLERSIETRQKISAALTGKESPLKGKILGPYSDERKEAIKAGINQYMQLDSTREKKKDINKKLKGRPAWNKGKTKETDSRVEKYSATKRGKSRPDMVGKLPWNAGQNKSNNQKIAETSEKLKGRVPWNKGIKTTNKGKSYEEIYGKDLAEKMKAARSNTAWINNGLLNKKVKLEELDVHLQKGWIKGRLMPKRKV